MRQILLTLLATLVGAPVCGDGLLLLTFDDRHLEQWTEALPLFERFGAHVSFFPHGPLGPEDLEALSKLHAAGHTVGPHTVGHTDLVKLFVEEGGDAVYDRELKPQMDAFASVGIWPTAMAYPRNRHTAALDRYLQTRGFRRFRAGQFVDYRGSQTAIWTKNGSLSFPMSELPFRQVLEGIGIGQGYGTNIEDVSEAIERTAVADGVLVLYSHDIQPAPSRIGMRTDWLVQILETSQKAGMKVVGLDELDAFIQKEVK